MPDELLVFWLNELELFASVKIIRLTE